MIGLGLGLCFSGLGALSLSTDRHHEQVFDRKPGKARRQLLRLLGWLLLASAIAPCIHSLGPSVGLALWTCALGLAAVGVMLLLSYRPRLLPTLSALAPPLALLLLSL